MRLIDAQEILRLAIAAEKIARDHAREASKNHRDAKARTAGARRCVEQASSRSERLAAWQEERALLPIPVWLGTSASDHEYRVVDIRDRIILVEAFSSLQPIAYDARRGTSPGSRRILRVEETIKLWRAYCEARNKGSR